MPRNRQEEKRIATVTASPSQTMPGWMVDEIYITTDLNAEG